MVFFFKRKKKTSLLRHYGAEKVISSFDVVNRKAAGRDTMILSALWVMLLLRRSFRLLSGSGGLRYSREESDETENNFLSLP